MHRLILMRHAEAAVETGAGDHARPLTRRGQSEAVRAGEALAEVGCPEFALVSDSRRTRETFDIVQDRLGVAVPHRLSRDLYGASPRVIMEASHDVPPALHSLLIVGHNPGIADLVGQSTRDGNDPILAAQAAQFSTACFAVIAADAAFLPFGKACRLERLFRPDTGLLPGAVLRGESHD